VKSLFAIGDEGRTVDSLLARLEANRGRLVADVRALPLRHKRGFSKNAFAEALEGGGIAYAHRVALGTPKSMRTCYRHDHAFAALNRAFDKYLEYQNHSLLELIELARRWRAFLLCFEADPALCHGSVVAGAAERLGVRPPKHL
jgi:uncharacterized protein (DUF488 family)